MNAVVLAGSSVMRKWPGTLVCGDRPRFNVRVRALWRAAVDLRAADRVGIPFLGVTVFSTVAMVLYPLVLHAMGLNAMQSDIFLGGTIHDVAQVVAAGALLGSDAADTATVVKLFRVLLLMPVVFVICLAFRSRGAAAKGLDKRVPLVPGFLLAFVALVAVSSTGVPPARLVSLASDTSRWLLVIAIAAAGVKTSFEDLLKLGWQPIVMLVVETLFIAMFVAVTIFGLQLGLA